MPQAMHSRTDWRTLDTPSSQPLPQGSLGSKFSKLSDLLVQRIARFYLTSNPVPMRIRLVNKRLSLLTLPLILHTISLCCARALQHLIAAPYSPLYYEPFTRFVKCLEFKFNPFLYELRGVKVLGNAQIELPKRIDVIRFCFRAGFSFPLRGSSTPYLTLTYLQPSDSWANESCLSLLKQLNPMRLEWICPYEDGPNSTIHWVRTPATLLELFTSWTHLSSVYLDGIITCSQSIFQPWSISLHGTATSVHLRGPAQHLEKLVLEGRVPLRGEKRHQVLRLENSDLDGVNCNPQQWNRLVLGEGRVVFCRGWSHAQFLEFGNKIYHTTQSSQDEMTPALDAEVGAPSTILLFLQRLLKLPWPLIRNVDALCISILTTILWYLWLRKAGHL